MPKHFAFLKQRGQGAVEMALTLPILIYLSVGGADFARGITEYIQVVNAADAGSQYASMSTAKSTDCTDITTVVTDNLSGISNPTITCGTPTDDGTGEGMKKVTITVSATFNLQIPVVNIFASSVALSSSSTMRVNPNGT